MQIWIAAAVFASVAALWKPMAHDRSRLRSAIVLLFLWGGAFAATHWPHFEDIAFALLALAAVQVIAVLTFDVLLRRVRHPKFISEMLLVVSYASILFHLLLTVGVNVTGIFATSAVAAAVVGLALQDMLSNIAGGIALEFEGGIGVGEFIRCAEFSGWVQHVRLRHTAILTSDGDTVILPNSQLTRLPVHVASHQHRHFVPFHMNYGHNPQELIEAVETALRSSPIPGVLSMPAPRCVIREMDAGHVKYAAIIWTDTPGREVDLNAAVLLRLHFALERAGTPVSPISYVLESDKAPRAEAVLRDPLGVLRSTPILRLLDDADLHELSRRIRHLSFGPGEHIIRQGEEGSSMYFIVRGDVSIAIVGDDGSERVVSCMEPGDFFGEASLLTGEKRNASAIARTRVDCYRLDKDALRELVERRVELAEDMSVVMAHRHAQLTAVREQLDIETANRREAEDQTQLLARIRKFFGVTATGAKA